jgi:two-component system KDP operon response regulator KdpE
MLRGRNDFIPIVALSNRANESSIVQALDLGADAYLTKPFGTKELFARMRNLLRHPPTVVHGEHPLLRSGDLSVDLSRRLVKVGEKQVKLTRTEYEFLRIFLQNAGKVLTTGFCSANSGTIRRT